MNRLTSLSLIIVLVAGMLSSVMAQSMGSGNFDKLKSLEGKWEGTSPDGNAVEISYNLMSRGTALVEMLQPAAEPGMVTVYHMDGEKLMMTHYCSAGNQPRMVADGMAGDSPELKFNVSST